MSKSLSTLEAPVYKVKEGTLIHKQFHDLEQPRLELKDAMQQVRKAFPEIEDDRQLGVWSTKRIGLLVGSKAEQIYSDELTKQISHGYRIFKKRSPMFAKIGEIVGDKVDHFNNLYATFRFTRYEHFGLSNVSGTHLVDGDLYIGLRDVPENNAEDLIHVEYSDYLKAYANTIEK